jgi:uncharacterized membrane protein YhaH (DUF805 family)
MRDLVRRDLRGFLAGVVFGVAAMTVALLWRAGVLSAQQAAPYALVLGGVGVALPLVVWSLGNRRIRDRVYVATPAFLAAPALVGGVAHYTSPLLGFVVSVLLALAASAAFGARGLPWRRSS